MTLRIFLSRLGASLMLALGGASTLAETMDLQVLRESVQQHLLEYYASRGGETVIEVGALDPRVRLQPCEDGLTMTVKEPPQAQGNVTVKTACESGQRWTIYVPARVDVFGQVAVAARSLPRGHLVTEADVDFQRSNVSRLGFGHVTDPDRLVGQELQRPMRAGDAFRLTNLESPEVVKRGDSVVVEAQTGGLTVVAPGKALGNGRVGQQIRVENSQSRRIIDARVVGPGRVQVLL